MSGGDSALKFCEICLERPIDSVNQRESFCDFCKTIFKMESSQTICEDKEMRRNCLQFKFDRCLDDAMRCYQESQEALLGSGGCHDFESLDDFQGLDHQIPVEEIQLPPSPVPAANEHDTEKDRENRTYRKIIEANFSTLDIHMPLTDPRQLNPKEEESLQHLINGFTELVESPVPMSFLIKHDEQSTESLDHYIFTIIDCCKRIQSFICLPFEDRISLLKAKTFELLLIKSILLFDTSKNAWIDGSGEILQLETIEKYGHDFYHAEFNFFNSIDSNFRHHKTIIMMLMGIVLFNCEDPNLQQQLIIKKHHLTYIYLLRRYLEVTLPSNVSAYNSHINLISKIDEVQKLCTFYKRLKRECRNCDLFLRRIFE